MSTQDTDDKYDRKQMFAKKCFLWTFALLSILVQVIAFAFCTKDGTAFFFVEVGGEVLAALFALFVMAMMW